MAADQRQPASDVITRHYATLEQQTFNPLLRGGWCTANLGSSAVYLLILHVGGSVADRAGPAPCSNRAPVLRARRHEAGICSAGSGTGQHAWALPRDLSLHSVRGRTCALTITAHLAGTCDTLTVAKDQHAVGEFGTEGCAQTVRRNSSPARRYPRLSRPDARSAAPRRWPALAAVVHATIGELAQSHGAARRVGPMQTSANDAIRAAGITVRGWAVSSSWRSGSAPGHPTRLDRCGVRRSAECHHGSRAER
jgi:hypothetical protein